MNPIKAAIYEGDRFVREGNYAKAVESYSTAIDHEPELGIAYYKRGEAQFIMRNYYAALSDFSRTFEIDPEYGSILASRAVVYLAKGNYEKAADDFSEALRILDPPEDLKTSDFVRFYYGRAICYLELEESELAEADFAEGRKHDPTGGDLDPRRICAEDMDRIADYLMDPVDELLVMATSEDIQDNFDAAVDYYSLAIALEPDKGEFYYHRAHSHLAAENYRQAVRDFTAAQRIDPEVSVIYSSRALCYYSLSQFDNAIDDFSKAIDLDQVTEGIQDDTLARHYYGRGMCYRAIDDDEQADADFALAETLDPDGECDPRTMM